MMAPQKNIKMPPRKSKPQPGARPKGEFSELTQKQETFALIYVQTGHASRAYREAYEAEDMSNSAVASEAYRLLKHPKVAPIIASWRKQAQSRLMVTLDSVTEELEWARQLAVETGNASAAKGAAVAKATLHGFYKEKIDLGGQVQLVNTELLDKLSTEERAEMRKLLLAAAARDT